MCIAKGLNDLSRLGDIMDDFEYDYEKLLIENELMYDNLGDFNIPSLEYLIHICEIIIESKQWNEGYF